MHQKGGLLLQNQPCGYENGEEEDKEEVCCGMLVILYGLDGLTKAKEHLHLIDPTSRQ